jgi:hypothetical protein
MTAVACGLIGCRRDEDLALVKTSYGPRVLCDPHRRDVTAGRAER